MSDPKSPRSPAMTWALTRFSIVGPLLARPPTAGGLDAELEALAAQRWQHPMEPDRYVRFGFSTIERWYYIARAAVDPVAALCRNVRRDAGTEKALSRALAEELGKQYGAHRGWTYQLHADNIAVLAKSDPSKYGKTPSYATVRRAMQRRGWKKVRVPRNATAGRLRAIDRLDRREVRSFEAEAVHALWHFDFHQAHRAVLDARGEWQRPVALCILDDRSRLCCHMQWYLAETAENLVHGLCQAFCKRGLPRAITHDNGAAMIAAETREGVQRLGITDEPTLPYSPYQNGKQEDFWGQVEGRLMAMLENVDALDLAFLNRCTAAWIEGDYNHHEHDEIGCTPISRMLAGPDVSRPAPDVGALRQRFTRHQTRTHRKSDGTVSIDGVRFEVPSRLRTFDRLHVRYAEWDLSTAWIVDPRRDDVVIATIRPVDKAKNAMGRRRSLEPVSADPLVPEADGEELPPLMKKLLADYAATGLLPSYLPKDERLPEPDEDDDA